MGSAGRVDAVPAAREVLLSEDDIRTAETFARIKHTDMLVVFFDDIEGSIAIRERLTRTSSEDAYHRLRQRHDELLREVICRDGAGVIIKSTGDGVLAAFTAPTIAVERSLEVQRRVRAEGLPPVRIGLDAGQVRQEGTGVRRDLFGRHVDRAARAMAAAGGGHICVTAAVQEDAEAGLEASRVRWVSHGMYRPKRGETPFALFEPHDPDTSPLSAVRSADGGLPAIWNVPFARNPCFQEHGETLAAIGRVGSEATGPPITVLHGLPGTGKTQHVVEWAYQNAMRWDVVWWMRADDAQVLESDYAALADRLGTLDENLEHVGGGTEIRCTNVPAAVRKGLAKHQSWCLIFDDAADPRSIRPYVPSDLAGGIVVVTSVNPAWRAVGRVLPMKGWSRAETVRFLIKRTSQVGADGADDISDALGDLPLAVEQAAALIEEAAMSFDEYLSIFNDRSAELLSRRSASEVYPHSAAVTLSLAYERAQSMQEWAKDVLERLSCFAAQDVPRALLDTLEANIGKLCMAEAIVALRRFSLIEMRGDAFSVHRLVQTVVRDGMSFGSRRRCTAEALHDVGVVLSRLPEPSIGPSRPDALYEAILPHALVVLDRCRLQGSDVPEDEVAVLSAFAGWFLAWGRVDASEALLARASTVLTGNVGMSGQAQTRVLIAVASVARSRGRWREAKILLEHASSIIERLPKGEMTERLRATVTSRLASTGSTVARLRDGGENQASTESGRSEAERESMSALGLALLARTGGREAG